MVGVAWLAALTMTVFKCNERVKVWLWMIDIEGVVTTMTALIKLGRLKGLIGLKLLMLGLMFVSVGLIVFFFSSSGIMTQAVRWQQKDRWAQYAIDFPSFTEMRGDQLLKSFSAKKFAITRRSFLAFQTRSIQQALFQDAHLQLYHYKNDTQLTSVSLIGEFGSLLKLTTPVSSGGSSSDFAKLNITQVVLEPFALDLFMDHQPTIRLQAQSALVNQDRTRIKFVVATLEHRPTHKKIASEVIWWSEKKQAFEIPGTYYADSPKGKAVAKGLQVGLNFSLSVL